MVESNDLESRSLPACKQKSMKAAFYNLLDSKVGERIELEGICRLLHQKKGGLLKSSKYNALFQETISGELVNIVSSWSTIDEHMINLRDYSMRHSLPVHIVGVLSKKDGDYCIKVQDVNLRNYQGKRKPLRRKRWICAR